MVHSMTKATLVLSLLAFVGCGVESTPSHPITELPEIGQSEEALIGVEGGVIQLGDAELVIPEAALAEETEIRVSVVEDAAPPAFSAYSPVFRFEPAGQVFDEPVTISIPYDGDDGSATIFWTSHGTGSFMALPTTVEDGIATATVTHFSEGFVGSGCSGDDCCDAANGELDLLIMVDNSNSMQEEQAALAEQLPRMARILATGDLDDDGVQDFPALTSVRVGFVTSDMGSGGFTIQTCEEPMFGDDGQLRTEGASDVAGCDASYPAFAEFGADDSADAVDDFVRHVQCVGLAGTGGCGFEQQLEAILKSVTPSTSPLRFVDDTTGHGDGVNNGFLREESLVAFMVLTDEGDCSTPNSAMFNPSRDDFGPLNVRCALQADELHPVSRYIDGLQAIRESSDDVIFGLIAGVPADLVGDSDELDFDAILADPRMEPQINPSNPNELLTSCDTARGAAYPPRRMVEVAQGFGGNAVVQSICQEDFAPVIGAILERVASRARGECL